MKVRVTTVTTYDIPEESFRDGYSTADPDQVCVVEEHLLNESGDYLMMMLGADGTDSVTTVERVQ